MELAAGFWDDMSNVDQELSMFVAGMWTALHSADGTYFYNQVNPAIQGCISGCLHFRLVIPHLQFHICS